MNIHKIKSVKELQKWISLEKLALFLNKNLKPYEDSIQNITHGFKYAFSKSNGKGGFILLGEVEAKLMSALVMLHTGMEGFVPENLLLYVAVDPAYRGHGLGKQLIDYAVKECTGDIKLHVGYESPAKRLYERMGFISKYTEMRFYKK